MNISHTEQILLDALKEIARVADMHIYSRRYVIQANDAIKQFEQEKERIANIPPY